MPAVLAHQCSNARHAVAHPCSDARRAGSSTQRRWSYVYSKDREIPIWFWASSRRLYTCTGPHECYFEGRGPCCYVRTASVPSSGVLCGEGAAAPQERRATCTSVLSCRLLAWKRCEGARGARSGRRLGDIPLVEHKNRHTHIYQAFLLRFSASPS